jgi:hypothetical protein
MSRKKTPEELEARERKWQEEQERRKRYAEERAEELVNDLLPVVDLRDLSERLEALEKRLVDVSK